MQILQKYIFEFEIPIIVWLYVFPKEGADISLQWSGILNGLLIGSTLSSKQAADIKGHITARPEGSKGVPGAQHTN